MPYQIISGFYASSYSSTTSLSGVTTRSDFHYYYPLKVIYSGMSSKQLLTEVTNRGTYSVWYINSYGSQVSMTITSASTITLNYIEL